MLRFGLALSVFGVTLLTSCLKPSLDLYTPADSHEYIRLCLRDTGPACEILWPTVKGLPHDISILITNGDDTGSVTDYAQAHGLSLSEFLNSPLRENYARANIFPVDRLTTGTLKTLDGVSHRVVCESDDRCTVDARTAVHFMPQQRQGTVYLITAPFRPAN